MKNAKTRSLVTRYLFAALAALILFIPEVSAQDTILEPFVEPSETLETVEATSVAQIAAPSLVDDCNLVVNGGFETGDFTGWTRTATGFGINGNTSLAWQVGSFESTQGAHGGIPHAEPLNNSGQYGATAVETGVTHFLLYQDIVVPVSSEIRLSYYNRIKNFHGEVFGFNWSADRQDYKVQIRDTSNNVLTTLYQASALNAPPFSGGGNRDQAFFVKESFDISAFSGQTIRLAFEINVCCWFFFVDLDDIKVEQVVIPVEIDIKPGSDPNSINLGSNGVIPVAILSSADFDATTVDPELTFLGGAGVAVRGKGNKFLASSEDVNNDGLIDLVLKVETENLDPGEFQDGDAILVGETFGGQAFVGSDSIVIVPPE